MVKPEDFENELLMIKKNLANMYVIYNNLMTDSSRLNRDSNDGQIIKSQQKVDIQSLKSMRIAASGIFDRCNNLMLNMI